MEEATSGRIKVLLADDHLLVREGIRACLKSYQQIEFVGEAANGQEALARVKTLSPHVVLMDISMPLMNGLEATRRLRKAHPEIKVLILTMHEKKEFIVQIIQVGACGYVRKNTSPAELFRAIELVNRGETFFSPDVKHLFLNEYLAHKGKIGPAESAELSLREREVLAWIADGLLNKEIAGLLGLSVRTIEKHRERIMTKLGVHSVVELVKYAFANGILSPKDQPASPPAMAQAQALSPTHHAK